MRGQHSTTTDKGTFYANRSFGERMTYEELNDIQEVIFKTILPQYGYKVRPKQIELAHHILNTIKSRGITLAEAEVGIGKTHAYIIAAILTKRGRLNDFWNMGYYPKMNYADMAYMPIVISTSGIALQQAILRDYIPKISKILIETGIISNPLSAVLRKGKEHYVCESNLLSHLPYEQDESVKRILESLLNPNAPFDFADIDGLSNHVKRKICVTNHCPSQCPRKTSCKYQRFFSEAQSAKTDFQVCNHNYLLADTRRRNANPKPLLPNYQLLIIDEGHKFLQAARQMYGMAISLTSLRELTEDIKETFARSNKPQRKVRKSAKNLIEQGVLLFRSLNEDIEPSDEEDDTDRFCAEVNERAVRHLRKVRDISETLFNAVSPDNTPGQVSGRQKQISFELAKIIETSSAFTKNEDFIFWLEKPDGGEVEFNSAMDIKLCAIPKQLDKTLYDDLWNKPFPIILTSGTLSAGDSDCGSKDFTYIKRSLGLDHAAWRLTETSKLSPFNHREHVMLYISRNTPFPDNANMDYINAIADETEKLIRAAYGHTAVLFTSHDVLGRVYAILKKRELPFPFFRLEKGSTNAIEKFKHSGNGVLFASGSMWEGIDIPGDALSMLVIVKLPFQVPDPVAEYERSMYPSIRQYLNHVVVPDMLIKLRQGFGRLVRKEDDTGVVAILDCRANEEGQYREQVLAALPDCWVTEDLLDVEGFFRVVKKQRYFSS